MHMLSPFHIISTSSVCIMEFRTYKSATIHISNPFYVEKTKIVFKRGSINRVLSGMVALDKNYVIECKDVTAPQTAQFIRNVLASGDVISTTPISRMKKEELNTLFHLIFTLPEEEPEE